MHPNLRRIRRFSLILAAGCVIFVVVLPVAIIGYWAFAPADELAVRAGLSAQSVLWLTSWQRVAGALISLAPISMFALALMNARACFRQFAAGDFFTMAAVSRLRRFAGWMCASVVAGVVAGAALSVLLTMTNVTGQRRLSIGVDSHQLFALFTAGMVWLIAAVMTRAVELADENAQFV